MSLQAPRRLVELAAQSLLRDPCLNTSTLDELPGELFPLMFMEAFSSRHYEILQAMVRTWPFPRLPLGSLMKTPHLETLRAVLEGLDSLVYMKVRPRRWKLQVLDLGNVDENFWTMWSGSRALSCSPEATSKRQTVEDRPRTGERKPLTMFIHEPLKVFIDVGLNESTLDEWLSYLCGWIHHRRGLVQLCCRKVRNYPMPSSQFRKLVEMVYPDSIQESEVQRKCSLGRPPGKFAPYLSQLSELHKVLVPRLRHCTPAWRLVTEQDSVSKNKKIKKINTKEGRSIKPVRVTVEACPYSLVNANNPVPNSLNLEPLGALLEKAASLLLQDCRIQDSQLRVILSALSCCSQLTTLPVKPLKDLRHTGGLSEAGLETYPAPLKSLDNRGHVNWEILTPIWAELIRVLREVRWPKRVFFGLDSCPSCGSWPSEKLELHSCS
uniref:Uncharacterized protein n=1 Tax=Cebus imitator TaxID=2715852 RepID=A0A2K5RMA8_CEBIM